MAIRKSKKLLNEILDNLRSGRGRVASCKGAGVSYQQFSQWIKEGSRYYDAEFSESVEKAEADGRITKIETCEAVIMKAATRKDKPVWQAAAWYLERIASDKYAMKTKTDITTKGKEIKTMPNIIVQDQQTAEQLTALQNGSD
jgi:hypothetical protein